jgi:VIT1/CCC1 family predicted Fe2+/Mn2+ transporter
LYKNQYHEESHTKSSEVLQDFVIGMADGLTVPFALVAGLSGVLDSNALIITAGVAEIAAGTIAMGLGGYLAARTEREHYETEYARETREIIEVPEIEAKETSDILRTFGVDKKHANIVVDALKKKPEKWREFMMRFELGLEKPGKNREIVSPIVIGSAYTAGGFIPLMPYIFIHNNDQALTVSVIITLIALLAFGAFKGACTGVSKIKSALHTCIVGGLAASAAYFLATLVS